MDNYKFKKSDLVYLNTKSNIMYKLNGELLARPFAVCCVCRKEDVNFDTYGIHENNLSIVGDYYYYIGYTHSKCRELFELNPLAYE